MAARTQAHAHTKNTRARTRTSQYASQLSALQAQASDAVDLAKRRDGLEFIDVDVSKLKPSW